MTPVCLVQLHTCLTKRLARNALAAQNLLGIVVGTQREAQMLDYSFLPLEVFAPPENYEARLSYTLVDRKGVQFFYTVLNKNNRERCDVSITNGPDVAPMADCSCNHHRHTNDLCLHILCALLRFQQDCGQSQQNSLPDPRSVSEAEQVVFLCTLPYLAKRRLEELKRLYNNPNWRAYHCRPNG